MNRTVLLLALAMATASSTLADDFVLVRAEAPLDSPVEMIPLLVQTDVEGLLQASGLDALPEGLVYADEPTRSRPISAQLNVLEGGIAQIAALVPAEPPGAREFRVFLRNAPAAALEPAAAPSVRRQGDALRVDSSGFSVLHDPNINAGLLSTLSVGELTFQPLLNDRVWDSDGLGGFYARNDPGPEIELVADGPVMAELRIEARYLREDGTAPEARPRTTYRLRYWAGLPAFQLDVHARQPQAFGWEQLHVLELHHEERIFPRYALDEPDAIHQFADDESSARGNEWGALIGDGGETIGILGSVIVHDGLGGYGRYLHGPWQAWTDTSAQLSRWVFASDSENALTTLDALAESGVAMRDGWVMTQKLADVLEGIRAVMYVRAEQPDPRITWRLSLIERSAADGAPLGEVLEAAVELDRRIAANELPLLPELPGGRLTLIEDGRLGIAIREGNTLASLYDMVLHREMLAAPGELFRLRLSGPDGRMLQLRSTSDWGAQMVKSEGGALTMRFEDPGAPVGEDLAVEVACELSGGFSRWSLRIDNSTQWSVDRVTMPALSAGSLGETGSDDTLYLPHGYGRMVYDPTTGGAGYRGYYPSGSCALPLLVMTDSRGGLYVASHDAEASTKEIVSGQGADSGVLLSVEVPAPDASVAGNDFEWPGELVIGRVEGGWYPASQVYRAWLAENAPWWPEGDQWGREDRPDWIDDIGLWVIDSGGPADVVDPVKRFAGFMQLPVAVHWYNWHQIPFDDDYPHYFPAKEGFRESVADVQAAGIRVVPYINGRLYDTDLESFEEVGHLYCTRDRDGEPYIEVYGSGEELTPMCIHTQFWRETVYDLVMRLVGEVGVDGVYIDQVAAARPRLCYDADHGHPLAGGSWWAAGYWNLLERLQADIADVNPEKMLMTESNAEPYVRWFDAYLMCNSMGNNLFPLFPAVYGSRIITFGRYMSPADYDAPQALAQKQGQLYVWGTQLWWSAPQVIAHDFAGPWLRDLAQVRYQVREFFNEGRMLAPPTLEGNTTTITEDWHRRDAHVTTRAILATAWTVEDGRVLVPMINVSDRPQTVTLVLDRSEHALGDGELAVRRLDPSGTVDLGAVAGEFALEVEFEPLQPCAIIIEP